MAFGVERMQVMGDERRQVRSCVTLKQRTRLLSHRLRQSAPANFIDETGRLRRQRHKILDVATFIPRSPAECRFNLREQKPGRGDRPNPETLARPIVRASHALPPVQAGD